MSMLFPGQYRVPNAARGLYCSEPGDHFGVFLIPGRVACGRSLWIIACDGLETGWEHVSVSVHDQPTRTPSWAEMCAVKDLFWTSDECVVQYHPPKSDYVNNHPGCLHLWRPTAMNLPRPEREMV